MRFTYSKFYLPFAKKNLVFSVFDNILILQFQVRLVVKVLLNHVIFELE